MKRRAFVKYTGLLASAPSLSFCGQSKIGSTRKLGIALVGLGSYSSGQLAPALQLTQHCELKGIVTGSPEKIPDWQKKYNIPDNNVYNYENMHTISDNDDIDVIYIVVPSALHAKYSIIAANAGKHVWCEKPMAMTVAECQSIIDACDSNNVKLSIGYRMLHETNTKKFISFASTKPYGSLQMVDSQAGYGGSGGGKGWRYQREMGGGALYDMGVYTVNGIRYATNMSPVEVISAKQYRDKPDLFNDVDRTTEYRLRLENGIEAIGRTSVNENMNHLRVTCERGWYEMRPLQPYDGVQGSTSDGILMNTYVESQQALQMDDDALAIINNSELIAPGIEGLKDVRIIEAIIKSAETGNSVMI